MAMITRRRAVALALAAPTTPAEFGAFIAKDMATWAEVVKATGTKPGT